MVFSPLIHYLVEALRACAHSSHVPVALLSVLLAVTAVGSVTVAVLRSRGVRSR